MDVLLESQVTFYLGDSVGNRLCMGVYAVQKLGSGLHPNEAVDEIIASLHFLRQPYCLLVVLNLCLLVCHYILNYKNYTD